MTFKYDQLLANLAEQYVINCCCLVVSCDDNVLDAIFFAEENTCDIKVFRVTSFESCKTSIVFYIVLVRKNIETTLELEACWKSASISIESRIFLRMVRSKQAGTGRHA